MSYTRNFRLGAAALAIGLVLLCNSTVKSGGQVDAQRANRGEQEYGLMGSSYRMVNFAPIPDSGLSHLASGQPATRLRRQVQTPQGGYQLQQQQQQPSGANVMNFLSELGPKLAQANAISSLFSPQQQQQQPSGVNPVVLMGQLSELIRSTQERNARGVESGQAAVQSAFQTAGQQSADVAKNAQDGLQSAVQSAGQQTADVAKSTQAGFQSALTEISAGLQRIATNNPNLVPDVKNLYQSVSSKLSSASPASSNSR